MNGVYDVADPFINLLGLRELCWIMGKIGQRTEELDGLMLSVREAICQPIVSAFLVNEHEILQRKGSPQQTTRGWFF